MWVGESPAAKNIPMSASGPTALTIPAPLAPPPAAPGSASENWAAVRNVARPLLAMVVTRLAPMIEKALATAVTSSSNDTVINGPWVGFWNEIFIV